MQISKYLLAAAIFAAGLTPLFGQLGTEEADDRDKAREELNRKMAELEAQLQATEEPKPIATEDLTNLIEKMVEPAKPIEKPIEQPIEKPVVVTPIEPRPIEPRPIESKPVVIEQPVTPRPSVNYPPIATGDALERARQEMRRKIAELDAQDRMAGPKTVVPPPAPKTNTKTPPSAPKPTNTTAVKPAPPTAADSEAALNQARNENRRKIAELDTQDKTGKPGAASNPSAVKPTPTTSKDASFTSNIKAGSQPTTTVASAKPTARTEAEAQALKAANGKTAPAAPTALSLIQAPPPAISAAKQARLNELLARYKADKITPEQYHAERARILGE